MSNGKDTILYMTDGCPPPDAKYIWSVDDAKIPEIGRSVDAVVRAAGGEPVVSFMLDPGEGLTPSQIERAVLDLGPELAAEAEDVVAEEGGYVLAGKQYSLEASAARIRGLRDRLGMTQAEAAASAGISEAAVCNYELGRSLPKGQALTALAAALGVRPEALLAYDFPTPGVLASALFQLCLEYGLEVSAGGDALVAKTPFMRGFLKDWADASAHEAPEGLEEWKSRYFRGFSSQDAPGRHVPADEPAGTWAKACFAERNARARARAGLTQTELAAAMGTTVSAVRSWEQGRRLPKKKDVPLIAAALGVTTAWLTVYDFGTPLQAAHALFQIADGGGLEPRFAGRKAVLAAAGPLAARILSDWDRARQVFGRSPQALEEWMSGYDPSLPQQAV